MLKVNTMRIYFLVCESKVNTLIWNDKGQTKKSYKKKAPRYLNEMLLTMETKHT
jgi:hypothetical protein